MQHVLYRGNGVELPTFNIYAISRCIRFAGGLLERFFLFFMVKQHVTSCNSHVLLMGGVVFMPWFRKERLGNPGVDGIILKSDFK